MTDLDELKGRINDPEHQRRAKGRADAIMADLKRRRPILDNLAARATKADSMPKRIVWLRKLAAQLAEAAAPHTVCGRGCSGCCYMPVQITMDEARLIARETGAALTIPQAFTNRREEHQVGRPCVFLAEGACTIYESRPIPCRTHYVVSDNGELCDIRPGEHIEAPQFNSRPFDMVYAQAHLKPGMRKEDFQSADIRTFFPGGLGRGNRT